MEKEKRYCKCGRPVRKDGCGICQGCLYQENLEAKKKELEKRDETLAGWVKI